MSQIIINNPEIIEHVKRMRVSRSYRKQHRKFLRKFLTNTAENYFGPDEPRVTHIELVGRIIQRHAAWSKLTKKLSPDRRLKISWQIVRDAKGVREAVGIGRKLP